MLNLSALIAAPFAAFSFALPVRPEPADLWRAGEWMTCAEFSELLCDCTGWTVEPGIDPEDPDGVGHWLIDHAGDRHGDIWPGPDLDDLEFFVQDRIDEALSAADGCEF